MSLCIRRELPLPGGCLCSQPQAPSGAQPHSHRGRVMLLSFMGRFTSTKTSPKCTCDPMVLEMWFRGAWPKERGKKPCTWNQWGATLWELIHLPAICSTQDSQQECYTSWQKHLPLTEWSTPACKLLMGEQTLAWQVCMRPAMTCSHPSFQGAAPTRGSSAPAEESPALCSSCSAQLDGKGFPAPNKPQADSQVSKPLAKGETVLLLFQVLCDLHLQSFWRLFPPTASSGGFFLPH